MGVTVGGPHGHITFWGGGYHGWYGPPGYRPPYYRPAYGYHGGYRGPVHHNNIYVDRSTNINVNRPPAGGGPAAGNRPSTRPATSQRTPSPSTRPNNVYSDRDGNVYRQTDKGWQQRDKSGWSSGQSSQTRQAPSNADLDRQAQARSRGTQQSQNYQRQSQPQTRSASPSTRGGGGGRRR